MRQVALTELVTHGCVTKLVTNSAEARAIARVFVGGVPTIVARSVTRGL